jgi:maltooligosyltrehalose synthase
MSDAAAIAPYLDALGISHLYASPCLKTRSGSVHGYAIVDYAQLNPELGSEDDYRAMFDHLDKLLDGQVYRLSHWKAAADEIDYRRFDDSPLYLAKVLSGFTVALLASIDEV